MAIGDSASSTAIAAPRKKDCAGENRHACRSVRSPRTRKNDDGRRGLDGCEPRWGGRGRNTRYKAEIVESLAIIPAADEQTSAHQRWGLREEAFSGLQRSARAPPLH